MTTKKAIIYTDGAADPNPGPAGIGAAIRDEQGNPIGTVSKYIGRATNNEAEYLAIIEALEKVADLGVKHVQLFSDSQLVVCQVNGEYRVRQPHLRPLYEKVKELQGRFESFEITHIWGETNSEAHNLANAPLRLLRKQARHK